MPAFNSPVSLNRRISSAVSISVHKGFTLIELVIGIVVLGVATTFFVSMLVSSSRFSADPWHQVRASELGAALMNEINAKSFDENSDRTGGFIRCNSVDIGTQNCTLAANLGADAGELTRSDFDDVDDYHNLTESGADIIDIVTSNGASLATHYANFSLTVTVFYDANFDGINDNAVGAHKKIHLIITDPLGNQTQFASYRSNY